MKSACKIVIALLGFMLAGNQVHAQYKGLILQDWAFIIKYSNELGQGIRELEQAGRNLEHANNKNVVSSPDFHEARVQARSKIDEINRLSIEAEPESPTSCKDYENYSAATLSSSCEAYKHATNIFGQCASDSEALYSEIDGELIKLQQTAQRAATAHKLTWHYFRNLWDVLAIADSVPLLGSALASELSPIILDISNYLLPLGHGLRSGESVFSEVEYVANQKLQELTSKLGGFLDNVKNLKQWDKWVKSQAAQCTDEEEPILTFAESGEVSQRPSQGPAQERFNPMQQLTAIEQDYQQAMNRCGDDSNCYHEAGSARERAYQETGNAMMGSLTDQQRSKLQSKIGQVTAAAERAKNMPQKQFQAMVNQTLQEAWGNLSQGEYKEHFTEYRELSVSNLRQSERTLGIEGAIANIERELARSCGREASECKQDCKGTPDRCDQACDLHFKGCQCEKQIAA